MSVATATTVDTTAAEVSDAVSDGTPTAAAASTSAVMGVPWINQPLPVLLRHIGGQGGKVFVANTTAAPTVIRRVQIKRVSTPQHLTVSTSG